MIKLNCLGNSVPFREPSHGVSSAGRVACSRTCPFRFKVKI